MIPLLETLLLDLRLGGGDRGGGVGVDEAAASLAVLELGADAGADADLAALGVLGAAGAAALGAVGVVDAAAGRELLAGTIADVTGSGGVGGQGDGTQGN